MLEKYQFQRKEHETVRSLSATGQIVEQIGNYSTSSTLHWICKALFYEKIRNCPMQLDSTCWKSLMIPNDANNQRLELAALNDAGGPLC